MTDAGSRQRRVELSHINGLDGLRGLAVIAVVLYHADLSWATGGFLGVEVFFVLSGFLITSLLIREWVGTGQVVLSNFWARRGRRLLPALFVVVIVIGIYYSLQQIQAIPPDMLGNGLSALFYYSNWHQIATSTSYFAQNGLVSPFQHTWSLSIEEQFYVVWPLLLFGIALFITRAARRRSGTGEGPPSDTDAAKWLNVLFVLSLVFLAGSTVDSLLLFHGGSGLNRVYFGTDTRATGLLSGAALAFVMARLRLAGLLAAGAEQTGERGAEATAAHARTNRRPAAAVTAAVSLGSALVIAALVVLMVKANGDAHNWYWLYPWGLLLTDGLGVCLIAVILTSPRSIANRIFSFEPLRWVGMISYGLYLWHFPIFQWITPTDSLHGKLLTVVRILVSVAASVASYFIVEQPIRKRQWPVWIVRGLAPVAAAAGVVTLVLAANAASVPTGVTTPVPQVNTGKDIAGNDPPCTIKLANTADSGQVAPAQADLFSFQSHALGHGSVTWPTSGAYSTSTKTFTNCPPDRALVIGDSIAFTISEPYLYDEQKYGMAISDAAILGCAFAIRGQLDVTGTWENPPKGCANELSRWSQLAGQFKANEIVFELGYRDEFNWRWNGKLVHLGEPAFDNYVEGRIKQFIKVLGENGKRKLLFLTVPYVQPATLPGGGAQPQASTARHVVINKLITQAAKTAGSNASVLNIDTWLSPQGHYTGTLNGTLCRFDGIHVTPYCSGVLEPHIFLAGRELLGYKTSG